jgi:hypothetical protein
MRSSKTGPEHSVRKGEDKALDALTVGITTQKVSWVLDAEEDVTHRTMMRTSCCQTSHGSRLADSPLYILWYRTRTV